MRALFWPALSTAHIQERYNLAISFIVGTIMTIILSPYLLFHPTDMSYLELDAAQNFFGWAFFRQDSWHWPITQTTNLLYPTSTSVVFTDSYPILSILLKCLSPLLPPIFIFNGFVLLLNFSLLFYSGNLLLRKATQDYIYSFIGGLFFACATPFFNRVLTGHFALSSHWLITLGLIPLVTKQEDYRKTLKLLTALLLCSFGIHAYLSSMLLILIITYIFQLLITKKINIGQLMSISFLIFFLSALTMYLLGYFINSSTGQATGFGFNCANLLTFFNPIMHSSTFFPALNQPNGQAGGYAYLGLGVFLMLPFCFYYIYKEKPYSRCMIPLFIMLIVALLFSLSNNIYCGTTLLVHYDANFSLFNIFRASQRYIWLVYYPLLFFAILSVFKVINKRAARRSILFILLVFQLIDILPLLVSLHVEYLPKNRSAHYNVDNPYWFSLNTSYKHMYIDPSYMNQFNFDANGYSHVYKFAYIALTNNITLNDFYLARSSKENEDDFNKTYFNFLNGILAPDTIYIMDEKTVKAKNLLNKLKNYNTVDGYYIFSAQLNEPK